MKRTTSTALIISLVMCLTMAFPASAAVYADPNGKTHEELLVIRDRMLNAAQKSIYSSYCKYYSFVALAGVGEYYLFFSESQEIKSGALYRVYSGNDSVSSIGNYTKIQDNYANGKNNIWLICSTGTYPFKYYYPDLSTMSFNINLNELTLLDYDPIVYTAPSVNTSALESLISQAKAMQDTGYRVSTYQNLQNAITSAESLLNTSGYTQDQIDAEVTKLQNTIDGLQLLPDASHLESLVAEADTIEDVGYTPPTWSNFATSLTSSRTLLAGLDYTTPQVDTSYAKLSTSMTSLQLASSSTITPPPPSSSSGSHYVVPYDSSLWQGWWKSTMKTIASASYIGMIIFIAIVVIGVFKMVLRFWF